MANPILNEGDAAPAFEATLHDGTPVSNATFAGRRTVLYFYPKDDTPGCTTEACDFRDNLGRLQGELGVDVYGISPDSASSHTKFKAKYELPFPLISDPDKVVARAYGVLREKKNYGKVYEGIVRSTFVIGADGRLEKVYDNVKAKGHVDKVLADLTKST